MFSCLCDLQVEGEGLDLVYFDIYTFLCPENAAEVPTVDRTVKKCRVERRSARKASRRLMVWEQKLA